MLVTHLSTLFVWPLLALVFVALAAAVALHLRSALAHANRAHLHRNELFRTAAENLPQGMLLFDRDKRLAIVNQSLIEMYSLPPERVKPGCGFEEYLECRAATGLLLADPQKYRDEIVARVSEGKVYQTTSLTADGRTISIVEKGVPGGGWVVTHEDISERVEMEAKLAHQANHDALTGLPNRALLRDRVDKALQGRRIGDRQWALLVLDLDRFKEINDTLGHSVGDLLLVEVAKRLSASVRESDTVARLGGDEFVILQELPHGDQEAAGLARKLIDLICEPFQIAGHQCRIGVSIGIAVAPKHGDDLEQLLKNADLALYKAKDSGRETYRFFQYALDAEARANRQMEMDLRAAIVAGELTLHYQPLFDLAGDRIGGFEALLRWRRPAGDMVSPADFIPLAEESGLILEIGDWVLRTACREATGWPGRYSVSVNVSPVQFKNRDFVGVVAGCLEETGLDAARLELEITESAVFDDGGRAVETLKGLRDLGVKIALDDFGTGYSSLTTLRRYKFQKIKIDRSFICDVDAPGGQAEAIVRSVVLLGDSLGLIITAEGVETEQQLQRLRELGCDEVQGYLIGRPGPVETLQDIFDADRAIEEEVA